MFPLSTTRGSNDLARSFERLFDESFERFFGLAPRGEGGARTPALDVSESDKTSRCPSPSRKGRRRCRGCSRQRC